MTQLDLYSKIIQEDELLVALLYSIEWLEDIYRIPCKIVKNIINFNRSAKLQEMLPVSKQIGFDIDSISTATDFDMDLTERNELKDMMRSVYYLLRKGKIAEAEDFLIDSAQV